MIWESLKPSWKGVTDPGHFQGVCQVMSRLLQLVEPDYLFMGQKDYQQCLVVQRLISLMEFTVEFHLVPTIREPEGLHLAAETED